MTNWKPIIKIVCLTACAAPSALSAVAGLTISPEAAAVMALLALIGGLTLSELQPGLGSQVSTEMIGRLADELEHRNAEREREGRVRSVTGG